jgi:DNA-directed RNA polymerase subunit RPC12/RpoP
MPSRRHAKQQARSPLGDLWDSFWLPPKETCPRCGGRLLEYYDPFLFSPVRTLSGKRRIKCTTCRFVWRPSSRGRSVLQAINPFKTY